MTHLKYCDPQWPQNDIDPFVLHRLEEEQMKPAPQADRRTLIRRVRFLTSSNCHRIRMRSNAS